MRDLAYRLYNICERKGWSQEALYYNMLVTSWTDIDDQARSAIFRICAREQFVEAHAAIQQWIEAQGLLAAGPPWETYTTDPADYPDPQDWKTDVFWPLAG